MSARARQKSLPGLAQEGEAGAGIRWKTQKRFNKVGEWVNRPKMDTMKSEAFDDCGLEGIGYIKKEEIVLSLLQKFVTVKRLEMF